METKRGSEKVRQINRERKRNWKKLKIERQAPKKYQ